MGYKLPCEGSGVQQADRERQISSGGVWRPGWRVLGVLAAGRRAHSAERWRSRLTTLAASEGQTESPALSGGGLWLR